MKTLRRTAYLVLLPVILSFAGCDSSLPSAEEGVSQVDEDSRFLAEPGDIPKVYQFHPPYPNPFSSVTNISIALPRSSVINLHVQNPLGDIVKVLSSRNLNAGYHQFQWDGTNQTGLPVKDGPYFITLESDNFIQSHLVKLKR